MAHLKTRRTSWIKYYVNYESIRELNKIFQASKFVDLVNQGILDADNSVNPWSTGCEKWGIFPHEMAVEKNNVNK